jgi:hypothetical protein
VDAGGATGVVQSWEFDFENELDLEMEQQGAVAGNGQGNADMRVLLGMGTKGGSGMHRAVALSKRRMQRSTAVQALWQQHGLGQATPDS